MKRYIYRYSFFFLLLIAVGCSSTQSSMYKPSDGGSGWKVNVVKKAGITDEFVLVINDSTVISDTFPLIGDNFEKKGTYRGKSVMMNGYRKSTNTTDSDGKVQSSDSYQIRVFIDDKQVDKFDF
ncbi:MAG TPA: hypothetical protein PKC91_12860 [Ignavibacteria bacterium]|nr:hypothetical protein [Ignavibacteria bacterium]